MCRTMNDKGHWKELPSFKLNVDDKISKRYMYKTFELLYDKPNSVAIADKYIKKLIIWSI